MNSNLIVDCEPLFFEGLITAAEYGRRIQQAIHEVVEKQQLTIADAVGFDMDELSLGELWFPAKWQLTNADMLPAVGSKLRGPSGLEMGIFRQWGDEKPWLGVWVWIKPRARLDLLSEALDQALNPLPTNSCEWLTEIDTNGTHYLYRELRSEEIGELEGPLEELIEHYVKGLRKLAGIRQFVETNECVTVAPS